MDPGTSDDQLLSRFVRGETAALSELARRYEDSLLGLARGLLDGRSELARDAVQDCWVRVIRYGKGFSGNSSLRTWLYRIVINRCRDLREEHARRNGTVSGMHAAAETPAADPGPAIHEGSETGDRLARVVNDLPGPTRLLLLLCYHHGLTHEQAAEVLGIPIGTLKSCLHAALETLRSGFTSERKS